MSHYSYMTQILFDYLLPNHYQIASTINYYNFGMVEFNWGVSKEESSIQLELYDINRVKVNQIVLKYTDLIFNNNFEADHDCEVRFNSRVMFLDDYLNYFYKNPLIYPILICCVLTVRYLSNVTLNILFFLFKSILKLFKSLTKKNKKKID